MIKHPRHYLHDIRDMIIKSRVAKLTPSPAIVQSEEERLASGLIAVVVPVQDSSCVVDRCLRSLRKYGRAMEVVIVDDGSQEPQTREVLRKHQQENNWTLIRNENAVGHSRACELGARKTTKDILCLLNSDTVLTPFSWSGIIESFSHDEQVAVVGPSTSHATTPQSLRAIEEYRFDWSDDEIATFAHLYTSLFPNWPVIKSLWRPRVALDEISGFAFFIRRRIWEQMDGFDSRLRDYGNETELCLRLRRKGYKLLWARRSYIHHLGKQTYGNDMVYVSNQKKYAEDLRRIANQTKS